MEQLHGPPHVSNKKECFGFNEYLSKIINGALPISAIDEYFKKADANGRQEVINASQDWFTKTGKALYSNLTKK